MSRLVVGEGPLPLCGGQLRAAALTGGRADPATLHEHLRASDPAIGGWQQWPEGYRDPASAEVERYAAAHDDYLARRAELGRVDEIDGISAGGMPDRVKCLHVLVAHSLAVGQGVNPLGDEALDLLPQWWANHPCTELATGIER